MKTELQLLCEKLNLVIVEAIHQGVHLESEEKTQWEHDRWRVTLRLGRRRLTTTFRMGMAHGGKAPDAAGVVYSLLIDARAGELSFEDFCGELGYDQDSRRAEQIWKACNRVAPRVRCLLGEHFEMLEGAEH